MCYHVFVTDEADRWPVPRATGAADLDPHNLQALIIDMGAGPGWYVSADLYRWYASMVIAEGLQPPSKRAFGLALRSLGYRSGLRRVDGKHVRSWYITNRALRGEPPPDRTQPTETAES